MTNLNGILNIFDMKLSFTPEPTITEYYDCHTPTGADGCIFTEDPDEINHLVSHLESQGFSAKTRSTVGGMPSAIDWKAYHNKKGEMVLEWKWWILALKSDISKAKMSKFSDFFELKPEHRGRKMKRYGI